MNRSTALLATALLACSGKSSLPGDIDGQSPSGKTDDTGAYVSWETTDEPLASTSLRDQICTRLGSIASGGKCDEFDFTVVRIGRSTLIAYQDDGEPVTVQLDVRGDHAASGETYNIILKRELAADYRLAWTVNFTSSLDAIHQVILNLADEAGEYPDWYEPDLASRVNEVDFYDLPQEIQSVFQQTLADRNDELNPGGGNINYSEPSDDFPYLEIIDGGAVIGYVYSVYDYIDHPLWDGSGATFYFDRHGALVIDVEWTG